MADDHGNTEFEALARRYWGMWGDAMRGSPGGVTRGLDGYRDALDACVRMASGGSPDVSGVLENFNRQGKAWLAQMQQVAAQFAGRDHSARDIAAAWRNALGTSGNPFAELFGGMQGQGMLPMAQWHQAAEPWLQGMRTEAGNLLGLPTFGFTREHQERLQDVGKAQLRWQEAFARYNMLMAETGQDAFARFEAKLAEREEPGRQLASVRALFDLWVDAAEEAYAQTALSTDYRHAYGELVNAQMQLRANQQAIVEQAASALGLPSRTELDGAHRKLAELERQVRRMQRQAGEGDTIASPPAASPAPAKTAARPARKPAVAKAVKAAKSPAKKASTKAPAKSAKTASKTTRKPAAKAAARKR